MVTMKQIDEAREELALARRDFRLLQGAPTDSTIRYCEAKVESLLRQWWAQGCSEAVTSDSELESMLTAFGNVKFDLGACRVDGDTARAAAKRLKALILGARVMHEAECVAADVLASRDAITKERDDWKAKYDALNKHREDQEALIERLRERICNLDKEREECKKDRAVAEQEIARLKHDAEAPVVSTYTDSVCGCGRHLLPRCGYVDDELGHHKGKRCTLTITREDTAKIRATVTREWVESRINEAIQKHRTEPFPHHRS